MKEKEVMSPERKSSEELIQEFEERQKERKQEKLFLSELMLGVARKENELDLVRGTKICIKNKKGKPIYYGEAAEALEALNILKTTAEKKFKEDNQKEIEAELARIEARIAEVIQNEQESEDEWYTEESEKTPGESKLIEGEEDAFLEARKLVDAGIYSMNIAQDGFVVIRDKKGDVVFASQNGKQLNNRYRDQKQTSEFDALKNERENETQQ